MTRFALRAAVLLLAGATAALAGTTGLHLVPAYVPCTLGAPYCPAVLASRFTFDSAVLKTSNRRYLKDDVLAAAVQLTGVRDETGALVTTDPENDADDFVLVVPATQITFGAVTYAPGLVAGDIMIHVELKNGKGKASYKTPAGGEGSGIVAEAVAIPYVLDSDGQRFAVSGSRDRPAD